jgi:hypothetical protein
MNMRKDQAVVDYPRAPDKMPDGELLGLFDICNLAEVGRPAGNTWVRTMLLPPADGPNIEGRPTWKRSTALLWLMARNVIPKGYLSEVGELLKRPEHKATLARLRAEHE